MAQIAYFVKAGTVNGVPTMDDVVVTTDMEGKNPRAFPAQIIQAQLKPMADMADLAESFNPGSSGIGKRVQFWRDVLGGARREWMDVPPPEIMWFWRTVSKGREWPPILS